MHIDINKILNYSLDEILFEDQITIDSSYLKTTEIRKLSDVKIDGIIKREVDDVISLNLSIDGVMILPCSISLEDVTYPFHIEVYEVIDEEINGEYLKIDKNSIDILPLIWQNIVLEIPIKVVSPNVDRSKLSGDGWALKEEN
jgi:uncharacterized protein